MAMLAELLLLAALTVPAAGMDGNVEWNGISHITFLDRTPPCPVGGESFTVRFQTYANDLTSATVRSYDGFVFSPNEASIVGQNGPYDIWEATVPVTSFSTMRYMIILRDDPEVDFLLPSGLMDTNPNDTNVWFKLDFTTLEHAPLGGTLTSDGDAVFHVWAPGIAGASVRGDFNGFGFTSLVQFGDYWRGFAPGAEYGDHYRYTLGGAEKPDARAYGLEWDGSFGGYNSLLYSSSPYVWEDADFQMPPFEDLIIYQLHVGTFAERFDGSPSTYRQVVDQHLPHLVSLGINAVQIMPVSEFPFVWSGGYNPITMFAPEDGYGTPDDMRYMVDKFHQAGIAVLLDVVWNHLSPTDNYLWNYTGSQVYFDSPAFDTPWGSQADYDKTPVKDYYADSTLYWMESFHIDGFRFDGTDYMSPPNGQSSGWALMQRTNDEADRRAIHKVMICEQLPDDYWLTRATSLGGAGYDAQYHDRYKYAMRNAIFDSAFGTPNLGELREAILGRLNDGSPGTLITSVGQSLTQLFRYFELHDECWGQSGGQRMVKTIDTTFPHDDQFARGRTLFGHAMTMFTPGIPAFFMGAEFLESIDFEASSSNRLDWSKATTYANYLLAFQDMIHIRKTNAALRSNGGVEVNHFNNAFKVIAMHRWDVGGNDLMIVGSLSNNDYNNYAIGFPQAGTWYEIFNSQASVYGGNGVGNGGSITTNAGPLHGYNQSAAITIPKMSVTVFRYNEPAVPLPSPDMDDDGDVDLADFRSFTLCMSGNCPPGMAADFNGDEQVTLADYVEMDEAFTGPN